MIERGMQTQLSPSRGNVWQGRAGHFEGRWLSLFSAQLFYLHV